MKKTRQTTSDTLSMKQIVGGVWAFVFFVAALLCLVLRLAWSQGGGIEAEVRGTASPAKCNVRAMALRCGRAGRVGSGKLSGQPAETAGARRPATGAVHRAGEQRLEQARISRQQPFADGLANGGWSPSGTARRNPPRAGASVRRGWLVDSTGVYPTADGDCRCRAC